MRAHAAAMLAERGDLYDRVQGELRAAGLEPIPIAGVFRSSVRTANFMNAVAVTVPSGASLYITNATTLTCLGDAFCRACARSASTTSSSSVLPAAVRAALRRRGAPRGWPHRRRHRLPESALLDVIVIRNLATTSFVCAAGLLKPRRRMDTLPTDTGGAERAGLVREKVRAAKSSVLAGALLTAIKLAAGLWTGSLGILAEAAHIGPGLRRRSHDVVRRTHVLEAADREHHYGHGKIEKPHRPRRGGAPGADLGLDPPGGR